MKARTDNRRLAQWLVSWLIEYSTSHQLLWYIDSFVLLNPPLRQAPKRYRIWSIKFTVPKIGVSNSPSGRLTD
jgi:hypothetical protein